MATTNQDARGSLQPGTNEASIAYRLQQQQQQNPAQNIGDEEQGPWKSPEFYYPSELGNDGDRPTPNLERHLSHAEQQELDIASLQEMHADTHPDLHRTVTTLTQATSEKFNVVSWNVQTPKDSPASVSEDPYNDPAFPPGWNRAKRWFIVLTVIMSCTCGTSASSVTTTGSENLQHQLGVSKEVAILGVTCFLVGLGLGPMVFAPLSEFYGRRNIYIISFTGYVLLQFPVAFANNPAVFFIFRFLNAFVVSSFVSVAGGTVTDLFAPHEVFLPMSLFSSAPFFGAVIAPMYSGFINDFQTSYRWSFYALIIWSAVLWVVIVFFIPETYHPKILRLRAAKLRKESGDDTWKTRQEIALAGVSKIQTVLRFMKRVPLLLLTDPMMLSLCLWSALTLSVIYLFLEAFPLVFIRDRGFALWAEGMAFCSIFVGMCISLFTVPLFFEPQYLKALKRFNGRAPPETRLKPSMLGVMLTFIGLWWFALTSFKSIHWIVPMLAAAVFGMGFCYNYISIFTYTADAYTKMAASGMAANALVRCVAAGAFPLFSTQMYERLGTVGAGCLVAGLNTLMIPLPFVFYKYGPWIRSRSNFASSPDDPK